MLLNHSYRNSARLAILIVTIILNSIIDLYKYIFMLHDEFEYDGNYKNLIGSVILNKNGQEVLLPQFE